MQIKKNTDVIPGTHTFAKQINSLKNIAMNNYKYELVIVIGLGGVQFGV